MHLKIKYMDMLINMQSGSGADTVSYSGYLTDNEGEQIYLSFGKIPEHRSALFIHNIALEYIAASLFLRAKRNNFSIGHLEDAISSLLERNRIPE